MDTYLLTEGAFRSRERWLVIDMQHAIYTKDFAIN
jgi:hypothetical protein